MYAQYGSLSIIQVGVWNRAKLHCALIVQVLDLVAILLDAGCWPYHAFTLEQSGVVCEDVRACVAYEEVNVLSINSFVQDVNIMALALLN